MSCRPTSLLRRRWSNICSMSRGSTRRSRQRTTRSCTRRGRLRSKASAGSASSTRLSRPSASESRARSPATDGVSVHRVAVLGASGFAGALCAHLVDRHPRLELAAVTARADAGRRLDHLYPRYRVRRELESFDADAVAERADAALVAYPHGAAAPVVEALRARGLKVADLSADFRLSRSAYERYYQPHEAPALIDDAVYGLTEAHRDAVRAADLVAVPGCYPTAALLALLPLRDTLADAIVDAKSGVSGAGREATETTHFVAADENVNAYKVEGHRHRAELEQELATERITFTPHLVPLDQGLLASC